MRFLDSFSVVLLDMNGTFMFGHDRFGVEEDYHATYRAAGGQDLDRERLHRIMRSTGEAVLRDYNDPARFDDFPSLAEAFQRYGRAEDKHLPMLERVFAVHEMGQVPADHQAFLRETSRTHHLGIVSNICARPEPWLTYFERTGLLTVFKTLVFSSECRSIKPSPLLFQRAIETLPPRSSVLFVGDSLDRDIVPAKAMGLHTAWIAPTGENHPAADVVVESLPALAEVAAEPAVAAGRGPRLPSEPRR
jgi:putative hydrolase of the HAD superfamily